MSTVGTVASSSRTALRWWNAPTTRDSGQQRGGLLGGGALVDVQGEGALLVEAERVDAVDDDLAGEGVGERRQQLRVALPGHGDDHDVGVAGAAAVVSPGHAVADVRRDGRRPGGVTRPHLDSLSDHGQAQGQPAPLVACPAEDADGEGRDVGEVAGVDTRGFGHEPNPLNPTPLRHDGWSWTPPG